MIKTNGTASEPTHHRSNQERRDMEYIVTITKTKGKKVSYTVYADNEEQAKKLGLVKHKVEQAVSSAHGLLNKLAAVQ
jgi:hypothetical protein